MPTTSVRSTRRAAMVTMQSLLGGAALLTWLLLSVMVFDNDLMRAVATGLPYFVAFELGILSRYVPGLRSVAKRLA